MATVLAMAREARQADSEWLPAELLPAADQDAPRAAEEPVERLRLVEAADSHDGHPWRPEPEEDLAGERSAPTAHEVVAEEPVAPEEPETEAPRVADEPDAIAKEPEAIADEPAQRAPEATAIQSHPKVLRDSTLPKPQWAPTGPPAPPPVPTGTVDFNQVTFDQLHRLGLSFHQAAGLIGRREQQGGYFTLDDLEALEGVYGIRREQIEALRHAAGA